ncbi:MAG: diguanylate cyclase [Candidatus Aminicenantes bacterium]
MKEKVHKKVGWMNVLIAEDDILSCRALEEFLIKWGYDPTVTHNGKQAWEAFKENIQNIRFHEKRALRIAILDWEMPGMDGIELCKKIRQLAKDRNDIYVYIILLTGKDRQKEIIKGLSAGADDYITKPFDYMELRVRLKNAERVILTQDRERKRATTDNLTQLWSRNKILEFLSEETEREGRYGEITGVIMADIDFFKKINDTHGHLVGDQVLKEVAQRLKNSMRRYDKIGRYGGDEFIAVFPRCGTKQISSVAERLRLSVSGKDITTSAGPLKITISIGATCSENHPSISSEELIKTSDKALMNAKKKGRNNSIILPIKTD